MARFRARLRLATSLADEYGDVAEWLFALAPAAPQDLIDWILGGPEPAWVSLIAAVDEASRPTSPEQPSLREMIDRGLPGMRGEVEEVSPREMRIDDDGGHLTFTRRSIADPWTGVVASNAAKPASGDSPATPESAFTAELRDGPFTTPTWHIQTVSHPPDGSRAWIGTVEPRSVTGALRVETTETNLPQTVDQVTVRFRDRRLIVELDDLRGPDLPFHVLDVKVDVRVTSHIDIRVKGSGPPTSLGIRAALWAWRPLRHPVRWWGERRLRQRFVEIESRLSKSPGWNATVAHVRG
ncbi:MAG: hypothetical protein R8F63_04055 [Acidimicrobiales bacterium]|nr:hypothetical protein [Acidimicrobiales bacterium]